jgi:hypothetical protein
MIVMYYLDRPHGIAGVEEGHVFWKTRESDSCRQSKWRPPDGRPGSAVFARGFYAMVVECACA